jgi:hypothetical protein
MSCCIQRSALVLVILLALVATPAFGATYYVRGTTGSDSNDGLSSATAFKSIKQAAKLVRSGDTVRVGAGTYTDDILVNGVQQSTQPAKFVVEYGDAIVAAQWKIVNSNYVEITGFEFQGAASRFLVWKGSYGGLLKDCEFSAGDQGLLVKSGSLTIDDCQIRDFTHDGIQVDGEARLLVKDSTISGCQEAGVEIRKVAYVKFDNCTVSDQVGDGIQVGIVTDSIDPGPDGGRWDRLVPLAGAVGPISLQGSSHIYGDLHHRPEHPVDPSDVTGEIYELGSSTTFPPIDPGDAASNNDNAGLPLTDKGKDPLNGNGKFVLTGGDGIDLPPGTYYFTSMMCEASSILRISGPTVVYVSGEVILKGISNSTLDPENFQLYAMGSSVDITAAAKVCAAIYAPSATITLSGGGEVHGMVLGAELDATGGTHIRADASLQDLAETLIPAPPTSPLPIDWTPVSSGELDIRGSTLSNNNHAVRVASPQALTATSSEFSNNDWGLRLAGSLDLLSCNFNANTTGGLWLQDITDADVQVNNLEVTGNTQYGVYAEDSQLTFDPSNIHHWAISGSQHAFAGVGSDLTFNSVTISGGTTAGVYVWQGNLTATNATFSGNGFGLAVDDSNATLTGCSLSGNTVGLYADQHATANVTSTSITNNTSYGISSNNSTLTLSGLTLNGGSTAGVYASGGNLTISNSTLSGSGYGIWAITAEAVVIDTCTLSGNKAGLYANQNTSVLVSDSTFTGNTQWGATIYPKASAGLSVIFDACTFHSNAGGLTVANAVDGQISLRSGTLIRDNTAAGLHFDNCTMTVNDQAGGANWRTLRNKYGISSNDSTLTLSNVRVEDNSSYGVFCQDSAVSLVGCTVTGAYGIYANASNVSLNVDASRFDASSYTGWGLVRLGGAVEVKNTIFNNYLSGMFLFTWIGDSATVLNTTIANVRSYGIYKAAGNATVRNTIVVGSHATHAGIHNGLGQLTHSHNLVHGFSTPFSGTTADSTDVQNHPRFVDAANGDLHLAAGSPAINAGMDLGLSLPTDLDGNGRPSFAAFEIGAYEYMSPNGSFRVITWDERR